MLAGVEGQEFPRAQVQRRRHMQRVKRPGSMRAGMSGRKQFRKATRGKRLRKSLTVAVFIVRLICITAPKRSRVVDRKPKLAGA